MQRRIQGFTLVELVIALVIGTILTSIALSSFNNARGRMAVRSAKATYASLHARARAIGIERGTTVAFVVDTDGDSAYIQTTAGVVEMIDFGGELNIDLRSSGGPFLLCMTPRGYSDCGTGLSVVRLEFWQNADSTSVLILPMGQLSGM